MSEARSLSWRDLLALLAFALVLLVPGLAQVPPTDRDESRYAVASTQMMTSGDLIDIRFQEEPRYLQPAGIYWLQSAAVTALSSPEAREIWAYRVPSLLACIGAVLITGLLGAALFGRNAGLAAGALLAMSFMVGFEARTAKTDAALLFSIVAAQAALLTIYLKPDGPRWRAAAFWAALGVGMMLKGPIILMVCGSTIAVLLAWDRKFAWLRGLHAGWGAPLFLAIALPWYVAISVVSNGDFFAHSVGRNLLGKVGDAQQSHAGPPGYYLLLFVLTFWPGSLLAGFAAPFVWRGRTEPAIRFLIAWIVPTWLIFEFVATKLPHYVLPTYPALAILAAAAAFAPAGAPLGRWRIAGAVFAVLWLAVTLLAVALGPALVQHFEKVIDPLLVATATLGLLAAGALLWFAARGEAVRALIAAAVAAVVVWPVTFAAAVPRLDHIWLAPRVAAAVQSVRACPNATLATSPYQEPSLVFLYGPDLTKRVTPLQAADVLAADPACALALIGVEEREAFLARTAALGLAVQPIGAVAGVNYSNGDYLELTIYAARPPAASR
ncbi:MAG: glycosyltransferase family 39 protein [Alphaproteobacteria bacterium]|nr:glycosyltransferase family 39 protein [Alphaproteobacteria bacterium]